MVEADGYWLECTCHERGDMYVCGECVKQHGKSTERPVDADALRLLPLPCGFHVLDANPDDYA